MPKLGSKSQSELIGVHPLLAACTWMAINAMRVHDATVFDGLRTMPEQRHYVLIGRSTTMSSSHLSGKSVDIVPYVDGQVRWDDPGNPERQKRIDEAYEEISCQMHKAAKKLGIKVENLFARAGWDKPHWNILNTSYDVRKLNLPIL